MEKNESNTGGKCGNCGDMTSTKCSRCKSTYYCNTNCQRTHWPAHKKTCQVSDVDTYIRRAGELLKAITLIFSEITYWNPVGKIDRSGKDLIVYDGYTTKLPGNFHKFPNNLVHGEDEKAMVLTVQMCEDVLGYFYDFTKDLLEGTCDIPHGFCGSMRLIFLLPRDQLYHESGHRGHQSSPQTHPSFR
jgi:hypothetical protein